MRSGGAGVLTGVGFLQKREGQKWRRENRFSVTPKKSGQKMWKNQYLKQWSRIVSYYLPHLSLPQARGLATWSFGIVMTRSSSLTRVSTFIARLNQEKTNTVRQRLKEWYQEAPAKSGKKRAQLEVSRCFAPLLRWVLSLLPESATELFIALDATSIGSNFTVLSVNVLYRRCAIPVAWCVVKATQPGAWKPHWQKLLQQLSPVIVGDRKVIVCTDRGLYADWLFEAITAIGWHPFLRINHQGTYRLPQQTQWHSLKTIVPHPGTSWSGQLTCFKTNPIDCTLLARWEQPYQDPWLILTDLPPGEASVLWYGLRCWIECSFRDFKSDGWQWHKTRLSEPGRAERHWLAMAVATLWMVFSGAEVDATTSAPPLLPLLPQGITNTHHTSSSPPRQLSCFLEGFLTLLADLLNGLPLSLGPLSATTTVTFFNSA
jgi:hypothetical protein